MAEELEGVDSTNASFSQKQVDSGSSHGTRGCCSIGGAMQKNPQPMGVHIGDDFLRAICYCFAGQEGSMLMDFTPRVMDVQMCTNFFPPFGGVLFVAVSQHFRWDVPTSQVWAHHLSSHRLNSVRQDLDIP